MKEKNIYAFKLVRSAIAPDTMVVAVVANESWKKYFDRRMSELSSLLEPVKKLPKPVNATQYPRVNCIIKSYKG